MNRILLADDSPQSLRLAEHILATGQNEVVSVTDGATALHRLADFDPDLLVCDVYLPTKNAFDLTRFIKAQPRHKRVRVVFAAGPADRFDEQDARNAGADAILRKPFEATPLLTTVEPLLEAAAAERLAHQPEQPLLERDTVQAAVALALESSMSVLIGEVTDRVLLALSQQRVMRAVVGEAPGLAEEPEKSAGISKS
jgi:CheY-like chemotaxis protein